jgi:hypothetical protein
MRLSLVQQYQFVSGSVGLPGRAVSLEGRLRGDELELVLPAGVAGREAVRLTGRVSGNSAGGRAGRAQGSEGSWSAQR